MASTVMFADISEIRDLEREIDELDLTALPRHLRDRLRCFADHGEIAEVEHVLRRADDVRMIVRITPEMSALVAALRAHTVTHR